MDYNYNQNQGENQYGGAGNCPIIQPVNKGLGVLGAAIGAILGGAVWCVIGMLGYVSTWVAILIFVLATSLYSKFSGAPKGTPISVSGAVTSAVFGVLVIIPADYMSCTFSVWRALNDVGRNRFPFLEVLGDMPFYMERYGLWGDFAKSMFLGLGLTVLCAGFLIGGALKDRKKKEASKTERNSF